jgi:nucleoside-diphosphate-sugar epimerase
MPRPGSARVLITGATGALGPRVVEAFLEAGESIRTLSLDEPAADILPDGVETLTGDVTDEETVASALGGIDRVVHLAALLHIVDPPPHMQQKYEQVNVGGTRTLLDAAERAGVKRVVLFSTIAVYGGGAADLVLDESSTPRPETLYAQSKLEAERLVLSSRSADGKPMGTVLRMAAVYGARVKGNYQRLVTALAQGRFVPIGAGDNRRTLVYDRDAARAAVLAASHSDAGGQVFNVTDGEVHSLDQIIQAICAALGRKPPRISLPAGPVRLAAGVLEGLARLAGRRSPITPATVDKYIEDIAVDGDRIRSRLGFTPQYSLIDGWAEAIQEMRRMGVIG